jgi:MFS family permease
VLGLVLIASQALFSNGVSFTFPLILSHEYDVPDQCTGAYVLAMAIANLLGPMLLGHWFDTRGRRVMISRTYVLAGLVMAGTELLFLRGHLAAPPGAGVGEPLRFSLAALFGHGELTALTQTFLWAVAFFFASAAASAGYLTVNEIFPVEMRGLAIALFFAVDTAVAAASPTRFGYLVETGQPLYLFFGYLAGANVMIGAGLTEWWLGLDTEQKSLEDVATPLRSEQPAAAASVPAADSLRPARPAPATSQR